MQCTNHLKQIGLGIHNFHDTRLGLPPSGLGMSDTGNMGKKAMRASFWALIFPFCEQQSLYDFLTTPNSAVGSTTKCTVNTWTEGTAAAGHEGLHSNFDNKWFDDIGTQMQNSVSSVSFYCCPTRRGAPSSLKGVGNATLDTNMDNSANRRGPLSDYVIVIAVNNSITNSTDSATQWWGQMYSPNNHITTNVGPFRLASYQATGDYSSWNPRDKMARWQDGTSNQLVVGEKALPFGKVESTSTANGGDMSYLCLNGGWSAMGPARPLVCGRTNSVTTEDGGWRVGILRGGADFRDITSGNIIFQPSAAGQPGYVADPKNDNTYGFGSWHSGVTNFVIGDGSVRSVSNTIDTITLGRLAIVDDGKSVSF